VPLATSGCLRQKGAAERGARELENLHAAALKHAANLTCLAKALAVKASQNLVGDVGCARHQQAAEVESEVAAHTAAR